MFKVFNYSFIIIIVVEMYRTRKCIGGEMVDGKCRKQKYGNGDISDTEILDRNENGHRFILVLNNTKN